jgi:peptidoglycan/LPS O-acetylase OafA/YrhL
MRLSHRIEQCGFRGPGFDRIRLIAATAVVLHHCSSYITENIAHDVLFRFSGGLVQFGLLAVYVFFAASGVLVAPGLLRGGDVAAFAVSRFLRIMPALLVTVVATAFVVGPALSSLGFGEYFRNPDTYRYLNNVTLRMVRTLPGVTLPGGGELTVNGALWTIHFEVLSYAALAGLFALGILQRKRLCALAFLAVYAANALLWFTDGAYGLAPERLTVFLSLFVYFLAGACIFVFSEKIPYSATAVAAAAAAATVSLPLGAGIFTMPVLVPYIVACIGYSGVLGREPLKSDYSYGIYLSHPVVLAVLLVKFPSVDSFFVSSAIALSAALALAFASWRLVERPFLRMKKPAGRLVRSWMEAAFRGSARGAERQ